MDDFTVKSKVNKKTKENPHGSPADKSFFKRGSSGTSLEVTTNYQSIQFPAEFPCHQYQVNFTPEVSKSIGKALIEGLRKELGEFIFDGSRLFTFGRGLNVAERIINCNYPESEEMIKITLRQVNDPEQENIAHHLILDKAKERLNISQEAAISTSNNISLLQKSNLEIRTIFQHSIESCDGGRFFCIELKNEVVRLETLFDIVQTFKERDKFNQAINGLVVTTGYDDWAHIVCGVEWDLSPESTFTYQDQIISYADYYRLTYGDSTRVRHLDQPLLKVIASKDKPVDTPLLIIPELSRLCYLTDKMRSNGRDRDLIDAHKLNWQQYQREVKEFTHKILTDKETRGQLTKLNIKVNKGLLKVLGRTLPSPLFQFGKGLSSVETSHWRDLLMKNKLWSTKQPLTNWCLLFPKRRDHFLPEVLEKMLKFGRNIGMSVCQPEFFDYSGKTTDLERMLNEVLEKQFSLILIVIPHNLCSKRDEIIWRKVFVENAVPCHVVNEETLIPNSNINSSKYLNGFEKTMIQINTKMGNSPWQIEGPSGVMFIGLAMAQDKKNSDLIFSGIVASMDQSNYFFSKVWNHEEFDKEFLIALEEALQTYLNIHSKLPKRIVIYQGSGQLVDNEKATSLCEKLKSLFEEKNQDLKLTFVAVKTDPCTRFLNPNVEGGIIVDSIITRPGQFDFFLMSRRIKDHDETPVYFNATFDSSKMSPDELQQLTFAQCHACFDAEVPSPTPAVLEYSEKMLTMVAKHLHEPPNQWLNGKLFFL